MLRAIGVWDLATWVMILLALAVFLLAVAYSNLDQGAHSSRAVKPQTAPYEPQHAKPVPPVQGPIPAHIASYIERGGAHPHGVAVAA